MYQYVAYYTKTCTNWMFSSVGLCVLCTFVVRLPTTEDTENAMIHKEQNMTKKPHFSPHFSYKTTSVAKFPKKSQPHLPHFAAKQGK